MASTKNYRHNLLFNCPFCFRRYAYRETLMHHVHAAHADEDLSVLRFDMVKCAGKVKITDVDFFQAIMLHVNNFSLTIIRWLGSGKNFAQSFCFAKNSSETLNCPTCAPHSAKNRSQNRSRFANSSWKNFKKSDYTWKSSNETRSWEKTNAPTWLGGALHWNHSQNRSQEKI